MKINAYLLFNGQCEEAFKFYEKCLGGKIEAMLTHEGTPAEAHTPKEWAKKILHARLLVGDEAIMASDAPPDHYQKPQGFSVSLNVDTIKEAESIFAGLSEGAAVQMPLQETFWAVRFAMLVDKYGIPWMINCAKES